MKGSDEYEERWQHRQKWCGGGGNGSSGGGGGGRGDLTVKETGKIVFNGKRGVKQGSEQNHSWQRGSGGGEREWRRRRKRKRRFYWKNCI